MTIGVSSEDSRLLAMCQKIAAQLALGCVTIRQAATSVFPQVLVLDVQPDGTNPVPESECALATIVVVDPELNLHSSFLSKPGYIPVPRPVHEQALRAALQLAVDRARRSSSSPAAGAESPLSSLMQLVARLTQGETLGCRMLATTVHDLRAPLMAAIGYCGKMLRESGSLEYAQIESLEQLQYCLNKVDRLSADLMHLSLGQVEPPKPRLQKGDIVSTIRHSLTPIIPLAGDKRILIRFQVTEPTGQLYFQTDQIERALVNILENACKFTPRGGSVDVHARPVYDPKLPHTSPGVGDSGAPKPNAYLVEVRDSGPGVLDRHLKSIFDERFVVSESDQRCGSGLGLAISRSFVEAHGGRIWAESGDSGLTVSFALLMRRRRAARRRVAGHLTDVSVASAVSLAS